MFLFNIGGISSTNLSTAIEIDLGEHGSKLSDGKQTSRIKSRSEAITGRPTACASINGSPKLSVSDGKIRAEQTCIFSNTWSRVKGPRFSMLLGSGSC